MTPIIGTAFRVGHGDDHDSRRVVSKDDAIWISFECRVLTLSRGAWESLRVDDNSP